MKLSRIGAAALCAALCLGTMSGCSSKTDGANEGGSQTAESQTTAGQTAAGKTEAGGAAGSDEKFTLKISTTGETDDNLDLAMAVQGTIPECGVRADYQPLERDERKADHDGEHG